MAVPDLHFLPPFCFLSFFFVSVFFPFSLCPFDLHLVGLPPHRLMVFNSFSFLFFFLCYYPWSFICPLSLWLFLFPLSCSSIISPPLKARPRLILLVIITRHIPLPCFRLLSPVFSFGDVGTSFTRRAFGKTAISHA